MTIREFRLPDAGEGLTEAEILQWFVAVGDTVSVNQTLVEIETAKAAVELPSPFAGVVTGLLAGVGETVDVGTAIIAIDTDPGTPSAGPTETPDTSTADADLPSADATGADATGAEATDVAVPGTDIPPPDRDRVLATAEFVPAPPAERESVLVGYGVMSASVTRRSRRARVLRTTGDSPGATTGRASTQVRAKPPVRKLAKDLGVDIGAVHPTGPGGTVTRSDVEELAGGSVPGTLEAASPGGAGASVVLVGDRERREPVRGVRKHMAEAMSRSAFTIPHVSEWVEVDVERSVKLVRRLRETPGFDDVRVSPLLLVAKAVIAAIRRTPDVNAFWDEDNNEVVYKDYVNLGIAAATPRGLVVPNIKDAESLSLPDLARALTELVETARAGRTAPADMAGGTFTITNVGVFGVDGGTPIINPGESAILAVGAFRQKPWVHKGKVRPRWVAGLTLSFDHRFVDGALGSRFLGDVAAALNDPAVPMSWS